MPMKVNATKYISESASTENIDQGTSIVAFRATGLKLEEDYKEGQHTIFTDDQTG